jgi:peptidoglycan/LPS O-acetylase OafA/YrhL
VTIYTSEQDFGLTVGQTAVALVLTTLVSVVVHRYYERPLRDLIRASYSSAWQRRGL